MRLRRVTLGFLLLAATAAGAAEQGGGPLAASKKALQELQADQATKPDAKITGTKPLDGLPQPQVPPPAAMQDFGNRRTNEKELKKKDRPTNWLLDGVEKLGRDAKDRNPKGHGNRGELPEDEEAEADSSDPDYMLKLYARQKKESAEKNEARQSPKVRTDPIAPFLQEWLGDSPVRGKFFDEYVRKSDAEPGAGSPAGPADRVSGQSPLDRPVRLEERRVAGSGALQSNPYLAGIDAFRPPTESNSSRISQPPPTQATFGGPTGPPHLPVAEPAQTARPAEKKPPLLAPSDNEKYFPQQKKF